MKTKTIVLALMVVASLTKAQAQSVRDNHLYFHVGFAAGNVYTAAFPSLATWGLNELTHSNFFESALEYSSFSGKVEGQSLKVKNYDMLGLTANDLFCNLHPSVKLGYQSNSFGQFNYGAYATAEYQQNMFKTRPEAGEGYAKNTLSRALLGGSLFAIFGGIDKPYRVLVEAGLRYSMALDYKGPLGDGKSDINNGLTSHYAIKVSGAKAIQDFGVYFDMNHFDLVKGDAAKLNNWSVGLMWTVTPGQRENRGDIHY